MTVVFNTTTIKGNLMGKKNKEKKSSLMDIIRGDIQQLTPIWNDTQAADDYKPVPAGSYRCRIVEGKTILSKKRTPGYRLTFEIVEGEHKGNRLFNVIWLTPNAIHLAKRDLPKVGINSPEEVMDKVFLKEVHADVVVGRLKGDDGLPYNRVRQFDPVQDSSINQENKHQSRQTGGRQKK